MIHAILPRRTQLCRKTTDRGGTQHVLATNIDTAFMVTAEKVSNYSLDRQRRESPIIMTKMDCQ
jgi:hypothetical protein